MIALLGKTGPVDRERAHQMLAAAPHRGTRTSVRVLGNCVLGMASRADFVDSSISGEGPIIAVLSGRLDNASELRAQLSAAGMHPQSQTDADLVVAAFQAYGPDAPKRMRGAFSGIVSDGRAMWCFRDHVGFRPLFYHNGASAFAAASEPRQVVVGAGLTEEPDFEVLEGILFGRMPSDQPAALKGVARLPQATLLAVQGTGSVTPQRFWNPLERLETARLSPGDIQDRFDELMAQAVARCLSGNDVILLSGGLDSPAVAAFAAADQGRNGAKPLGALSCVFPDLPSVDERSYIELVARHFDIELHTYRPTARALDEVEHWCRLVGGPVPVVSVPELADNHQRAQRLGYQTILTGDFAEFAFGSPWHLVSHLLMRGRWRALGRLLLAERQRGTSWRQLGWQVGSTFLPGRVALWYLHRRGLDAPERIPDWLDAQRVNPYRDDLLARSRDRWTQAQRSGTEGSTITMEADELCAALAGVHVRRPFADVDLWEFFLALPGEVKCPDLRFKTLPRRLLRGRLPDAILDRRRKTYFDDHVMTQIDYPTLQRLLVRPRHRMPGVDYDRLEQRLTRADFTRFDWSWAKDLARIHAFLSAW
jgi:asparagine synthase (glutamine-hydrolysing)